MELRLSSRSSNCAFPLHCRRSLTGLRVASGLAVIGAIVGEFIGGQGLWLGSRRPRARSSAWTKYSPPCCWASVLGLALFGLINLVSYITLRRWHASEQ